MKKYNLKRFLASLLAVLMLASVTGVSPAVFAEDTPTPDLVETSSANPVEVLIKGTYTDDEVRSALANTLLTNADQVNANDLSWTYTCAVKGKYVKTGIKTYDTDETREATVSVLKGDTQTAEYYYTKYLHATATYTYPALKDNADGAYTLYLNGQAVYINKVAKLKSAINVVDTVPEIAIPYNADGSVNTDTLYKSIFDAVVTGTTPANLTYDQLSYSGNFSEGEQAVKISYAGNDDYNDTSKDVKVKFTDGRNVAFTAKEQPETLSIGYVGNKIDVATTENNVRKQLVTVVAEDVKLDQVKVEFRNTANPINKEDYKDLNLAAIEFYRVTKTDIRLTYAGDATHKPFTKIFEDIKFADNRVASSIVFKENASITYNMESDVMKQAILDNVIDWEASDLPAKETLSINDFKFECNTSLSSKIPVWKDIAGDEYPNLDAGDKRDIRISFVGNSDFKPGEFDFTIKVAKAHVDVSMNAFTKAYAGNEDDLTIEKLGITLNPNDPRIDIYRVFVGINTNLKASVNLVLTDEQWEFIENVSKAQELLYEKAPNLFPSFNETIQDKLEKGMTIAEFKEYMNNAITAIDNAANDETWGPIVQGGLDLFHIDLDAIKALASVFEVLTMVSDDLTIAVGVPEHAGLYRVYAIAANKNYETNFASGTVLILMNWKDIKIVPNADLKKQTITVSEAEKYASGELAAATLLNEKTGESSGIDQSALHYRFTGLSKIYSSHDFPTAPGKYIVTVSVRGGDYYALPTTFTFTVKAD